MVKLIIAVSCSMLLGLGLLVFSLVTADPERIDSGGATSGGATSPALQSPLYRSFLAGLRGALPPVQAEALLAVHEDVCAELMTVEASRGPGRHRSPPGAAERPVPATLRQRARADAARIVSGATLERLGSDFIDRFFAACPRRP
jgi:hypothetical protein